jgi:hypothetical protein
MPIIGNPEIDGARNIGFQDCRHRWARCRDDDATALPAMFYLSDVEAVRMKRMDPVNNAMIEWINEGC